MTPNIQSKLPNVGITIFTEMSQLAAKENAVNLSQGFPDFTIDAKLTQFLEEGSAMGLNQYLPMPGYIGLREAILKKMYDSHKATYDIESEITITAGATQAIFTAIATIVKPGDEVIIIEPAYDCYEPTIQLFGGVTRHLILKKPDYAINWEDFKNLITSKTKLIIFNNPGNPSTRILRESDIQELIKIVKDTDIFLLSDEVYENITFDNKEHLSFARYSELKERSFIIASFGKLLHITGWKLGYVLAPKEMMSEYRKVHQYNVFCVNSPSQYAIAKYMDEVLDYQEIAKMYQSKRDYFRNALAGTDFKLLNCEATYFQAVDYSAVSDLGDKDFCKYLTQVYKVAAIPFSAFYHNFMDEKVIRFCFAKKQETLDQAIENLVKLKI